MVESSIIRSQPRCVAGQVLVPSGEIRSNVGVSDRRGYVDQLDAADATYHFAAGDISLESLAKSLS